MCIYIFVVIFAVVAASLASPSEYPSAAPPLLEVLVDAEPPWCGDTPTFEPKFEVSGGAPPYMVPTAPTFIMETETIKLDYVREKNEEDLENDVLNLLEILLEFNSAIKFNSEI